MTQSELHPLRPSLAAPVALQTGLRLPHVGASRFDALVAERGLAHVASLSWKTEVDDPAVHDRPLTTGRSDGCRSLAWDVVERGVRSCIRAFRRRDRHAWARLTDQVIDPLEVRAGGVPRTLAELYALAEGHTLPERRPIGFVRETPSTRG